MDYFAQITAMHQQVRTFIEQAYPTLKVLPVSGYPSTEYACPLDKQGEIDPARAEYVLCFVNVRFRVETLYLAGKRHLTCEVFVQSDGTLYCTSPVMGR